jgi:hypothetical protein
MNDQANPAHAPGSPEEFVAALERLLGPEYQLRVAGPGDGDVFYIHAGHGGRGQDVDVKSEILKNGTLEDLSNVAERIRIAIGP